MVIVDNPAYFTSASVTVDNDEYVEIVKSISRIQDSAEAYLENYIAYYQEKSKMSKKEFDCKYGHSTFRYFHDILGIDKRQLP